MDARFLSLSAITVFLLFSCGTGNPQEDQTPERDSAGVNNPDSIMNAGTIVTVTDLDSMLAGFPKYWVEIQQRDTSLVYVEYCGMAHPSLELQRKEDHWELFAVYGQDGEAWLLLDMIANTQVAEGQELMDGHFVVQRLTYPDDEVYTATFFWNKTSHICTFGEFFSAESIFADYTLKDIFVVEEEECDF